MDVVLRPADLNEVASRLSRGADDLMDSARRLRTVAAGTPLNVLDPGLDTTVAARQTLVGLGLNQSSTELRATAMELVDAARSATAADRGGLVCRLPERVRTDVDRWLTDTVGGILSTVAVGGVELVSLHPWGDPVPSSGDRGGSLSARRVRIDNLGGVDAGGARPGSGARLLLATAFDAMADESILAHDEFGLVDHGGDRYTIVLPGVTDLSQPGAGWNPVHRSVRDLDKAAVPSSRSTGLDDNPYARMVAEALVANDVPTGAELLIVGHSFGADTALDLASDRSFTDRYHVSQVVATGYFSQPQLRMGGAGSGADVLIVQNRLDPVVGLGSLMPIEGTLSSHCSPGRGQTAGASGATVIRFDGGLRGLGHSVDEYRSVFTGDADLDPADAAALEEMLSSLEARSFGPSPTMLAIDISLPDG